jgi:CheY-like chemotaxis protein/class 3 adenylate cyclase
VTELVLLARDRVLPELLRRRLEPHGLRVRAVGDAAALAGARLALVPARGVDPPALGDGRLVVYGIDDADAAAARRLGAAFLRLPFTDAELLDAVGVTRRERRLVLLVDDSPLIHRHTVPLLEEAGYEVVSAVDGEDGLARAAARRPDVVITDVEMPVLDGYGLCKRLKGEAATAHVPVLICSALGEAQDLERGFDAGADDYLVKPVLPEELTTRLSALLAGVTPASRERILVVDDSPAQRHYVADCLARQGFAIVTASDGREGLERASETAPALVVSDFDMPRMNGFEMVLALKRDAATRDIPVIMLTARDSRRDVAQMRAAGAAAYLVKPFAQDKCIATVERTLAERRLSLYKEASRAYISDGAARAAEARAGGKGEGRAEERDMSVLFSDICGFTTMSGRLPPREVIDMLNEYFDRLCPVIKAEGGDIDKFIGDAIMAVFDTLPGRDPAPVRAVRAALGMQEALADFNRGRAIQLAMRIGVNTGPVVRGDIGPAFRREFAVIGDTVNKANRYEGNAPPGGVLVSQSTRDALGEGAVVEELTGVKLKGIEAAVRAYVVKGLP